VVVVWCGDGVSGERREVSATRHLRYKQEKLVLLFVVIE
jgi:hypothetical protein